MNVATYPATTPSRQNPLGIHPAVLRLVDGVHDRPLALPVETDGIPTELRERERWVIWRFEIRNGKDTKVPFTATEPKREASSTDPATWRSFDAAVAAYENGNSDGIGYMLGAGVAGIDLDACRNPDTGEIEPWATEIISEIDSYTEVSPSGTGVKIFARFILPASGRRRGLIELYDTGRYFTVSGQRVDGTPRTIQARQSQLDALHARVFRPTTPAAAPLKPVQPVALDDVALLEKARAATNGSKFDALFSGDWSGYHSRSEADLALCNQLAFWTGRDHARIGRLFRQSGLMREKWDTRHGAATYGDITIDRAISSCSESYNPASRPQTHGLKRTATAPGVTLDDFHAYMPTHAYIFAPSRELWPAASVNARIAPVPVLNATGQPPSHQGERVARSESERRADDLGTGDA